MDQVATYFWECCQHGEQVLFLVSLDLEMPLKSSRRGEEGVGDEAMRAATRDTQTIDSHLLDFHSVYSFFFLRKHYLQIGMSISPWWLVKASEVKVKAIFLNKLCFKVRQRLLMHILKYEFNEVLNKISHMERDVLECIKKWNSPI